MRRLTAFAALLVVAVATAAVAAPLPSANVAPCDKAATGNGPADWRSEAIAAGPAGVMRAGALKQMTPTAQGLITKMPILIEGREPEKVTVRVPARLRQRVFLYYGNVVGRDGKPTSTLARARGYGETVFELCADRPRTVWPGGVRVKGRAAVHLEVWVEGRSQPFILRLGRPQTI